LSCFTPLKKFIKKTDSSKIAACVKTPWMLPHERKEQLQCLHFFVSETRQHRCLWIEIDTAFLSSEASTSFCLILSKQQILNYEQKNKHDN